MCRGPKSDLADTSNKQVERHFDLPEKFNMLRGNLRENGCGKHKGQTTLTGADMPN